MFEVILSPKLQAFQVAVQTTEPRQVQTAVMRLLACVEEGDPQDVEWLANDGASTLGARLSAQNSGIGRGSLSTYESRLRAAARRHVERSTGTARDLVLPIEGNRTVTSRGGLRKLVPMRAMRVDHFGPAFFTEMRGTLSLAQQLAEAYSAVGRWPELREFLVPALLKAEQALRSHPPREDSE